MRILKRRGKLNFEGFRTQTRCRVWPLIKRKPTGSPRGYLRGWSGEELLLCVRTPGLSGSRCRREWTQNRRRRRRRASSSHSSSRPRSCTPARSEGRKMTRMTAAQSASARWKARSLFPTPNAHTISAPNVSPSCISTSRAPRFIVRRAVARRRWQRRGATAAGSSRSNWSYRSGGKTSARAGAQSQPSS